MIKKEDIAMKTLSSISSALLVLALGAACSVALASVPAKREVGVVVDPKGKPIPHATIWTTHGGGSWTTISGDSHGRFTFVRPVDAKARVYLMATADGYTYSSGWTIVEDESPAHVKLVLYPEKKVKGKVVDENGKGVAGAKILLLGYSTDSGKAPPLHYWRNAPPESGQCDAVSGPGGFFVLSHVPDPSLYDRCRVDVNVDADGRASVNRDVDLRQPGGALTVTLPRECRLEGKLVFPESGPPAGIHLLVQLSQSPGAEQRRADVGKDGRFSVGKLPPGKVVVMLPPAYVGGVGIWRRRDTSLPLLTDFYGGPGVSINVASDMDKRPNIDRYKWTLPSKTVLLTPDKPATLTLKLVRGVLISGSIINKQTGRPFKHAQLAVWHAGRTNGPPDLVATHRVDATDGNFATYVAPGDVELVVESAGDGEGGNFSDTAAPRLRLKAVAGRDISGVEITTPPPGKWGVGSAVSK